MKIGLLGYGKTGKEIEWIALERGHEIVWKFDSKNRHELNEETLKKADVAIEFTNPESAAENMDVCMDAGVPVVVGSTGWYDSLPLISEKCKLTNGSLLYASNFSLGVNIFFAMNRKLAQIMNRFPEYKADIEEIHHTMKKDAPSGTAISLAKDLITKNHNYAEWSDKPFRKENELYVKSVREDDVPGTHIISYRSEADEIVMSHQAKNRKGFALGAIMAAEFLKDKKGIFTMKDLFDFDGE